MAYRITLFNHKGGVSKTTTTFNLGWMLAEKGKRVILVDADPQCNLTGLIMGFRGADDLDDFYEQNPKRNLKAGLADTFASRPVPIEPVECVNVPDKPNLFLIPGHIGISEYEVPLGIAQQLTGSIPTLQNLPGSLSYILELTAKKYEADYVLIDTSPSLGSINQNLIMTGDFFIVPTSPDYFSLMAINALQQIFTRWHSWAVNAEKMGIFADATYPLPEKNPKFLGYIIQQFTLKSKKPANAFQRWINQVGKSVEEVLVPKLRESDLLLQEDLYLDFDTPYCLAQIPNFQSLIAISQDNQLPVFALADEQMGQGIIRDNNMKKRYEFKNLFSKLADNVIRITEMSYAKSHR